ncbi:hypothetical protein SKAU_G00184880 [Synaphobranchus kaupii]|uniref:Uncharacterized protein n=1 Tax=Synaphobranchus kaupii TaxID=118154 RepID=A0A9Q1FCI9_SYNKA|nr:hypothetical protein SKAU_G00184880 [Synaphobranchus kaupii]
MRIYAGVPSVFFTGTAHRFPKHNVYRTPGPNRRQFEVQGTKKCAQRNDYFVLLSTKRDGETHEAAETAVKEGPGYRAKLGLQLRYVQTARPCLKLQANWLALQGGNKRNLHFGGIVTVRYGAKRPESRCNRAVRTHTLTPRAHLRWNMVGVTATPHKCAHPVSRSNRYTLPMVRSDHVGDRCHTPRSQLIRNRPMSFVRTRRLRRPQTRPQSACSVPSDRRSRKRPVSESFFPSCALREWEACCHGDAHISDLRGAQG